MTVSEARPGRSGTRAAGQESMAARLSPDLLTITPASPAPPGGPRSPAHPSRGRVSMDHPLRMMVRMDHSYPGAAGLAGAAATGVLCVTHVASGATSAGQ